MIIKGMNIEEIIKDDNIKKDIEMKLKKANDIYINNMIEIKIKESNENVKKRWLIDNKICNKNKRKLNEILDKIISNRLNLKNYNKEVNL